MTQQMVDQVTEASYTDYLTELGSFLDRNSYTENLGLAADYIVGELEAMGLQVELQTFALASMVAIDWNEGEFWAPVSNIIATIPGKVTPEQEYLLTAHYDSIAVHHDEYMNPLEMVIGLLSPSSPAPGVDDNASGTSAVLESARILSEYPFESTVKFVLFGGEEQGLVGSDFYTRYAYYVDSTVDAYYLDPTPDLDDLIADPDDIRGAVNYDMIAYWDGDPAEGETLDVIAFTGQTYGIEDYPNLEHLITTMNPDLTPEQVQYVIDSLVAAIPPPPAESVDSALLATTFVNAASDYNTGLNIEYVDGSTSDDWWLLGASDHFNFWWYGWPALLCIDDFIYGIDPDTLYPYATVTNPYYHSVDDNLDNANAIDMATAATRTGLATVAELAGLRVDVLNGDFDSGALQSTYDIQGDVSLVEVGSGNDAAQLTESSPAVLSQDLVIPTDGNLLTFDFRFVDPGDGDFLTVEFRDAELFRLLDTDVQDSDWHTAQVGISSYAGLPGALVFRLNSAGDPNAQYELDNIVLVPTAGVVGEIHGAKWHDLDGDGTWDAGEPGLEGWTIFLDEDEDGVLDAGELFTATDADGDYSFTGLVPDTYTVAEVLQAGWAQTFPGGGTHEVPLGLDEIVSGINFGNRDVAAPTILSWHSAKDHESEVGEAVLAIPDDGTFSESRAGIEAWNRGISRLLIAFDEAIDPATFTPSSVLMAGNDENGEPVVLSGVSVTTSTRDGDIVGVIEFSPALPDYARYLVQVEGVTDPAGNALTGDNNRIMTGLIADAYNDDDGYNNLLVVDNVDMAWVRYYRDLPANPIDPSERGEVRADIWPDGVVDNADMAWVRWARDEGHDASGIPDPVLPPAPESLGSQAASYPFHEGWESGDFAGYWEVIPGAEGRIEVTRRHGRYEGRYHVIMDDTVDGSEYSLNQLILHIDLSGQSNVELSFAGREWRDEDHAEDAAEISVDGGATWHTIAPLAGLDNRYHEYSYDLDALGLTYSSHTLIRFQQYDDDSVPRDGLGLDNIRVGPGQSDSPASVVQNAFHEDVDHLLPDPLWPDRRLSPFASRQTAPGSMPGSYTDVRLGALRAVPVVDGLNNASINVEDLWGSLRIGGDLFSGSVSAGALGRVLVMGEMGEEETDEDTDEIHADEGRLYIKDETWAGRVGLTRDHWFDGVRAWVGRAPDA